MALKQANKNERSFILRANCAVVKAKIGVGLSQGYSLDFIQARFVLRLHFIQPRAATEHQSLGRLVPMGEAACRFVSVLNFKRRDAMPRVSFTANIQRHVACPAMIVKGDTVRAALDAVFAENPLARRYVLDDQGALRKHMAIFIDGALVRDRTHLSDPVPDSSAIHVFQALSGG